MTLTVGRDCPRCRAIMRRYALLWRNKRAYSRKTRDVLLSAAMVWRDTACTCDMPNPTAQDECHRHH